MTGSRNLGNVFDKSRSLVFAWFVFTFFESRNFLPKSLGLEFLTWISASRQVSDFTIRHPSDSVLISYSMESPRLALRLQTRWNFLVNRYLNCIQAFLEISSFKIILFCQKEFRTFSILFPFFFFFFTLKERKNRQCYSNSLYLHYSLVIFFSRYKEIVFILIM